jgi:hypothetical protein
MPNRLEIVKESVDEPVIILVIIYQQPIVIAGLAKRRK